jgi:hypothetical protein
MTNPIEIIQEDRDAAAEQVMRGPFEGRYLAAQILRGESDRHALVQAFALHRTRSSAPLVEAGQAILDRMSSTYRARNNRQVSIQGEDGEMCWIVHSDDIEGLRAALAKVRRP